MRSTVYERLTQSVLVLHDEDAYSSFEALPGVVERHPNWRAERIAPTRGLPQFEELGRTTAAMDRFWGEAEKEV